MARREFTLPEVAIPLFESTRTVRELNRVIGRLNTIGLAEEYLWHFYAGVSIDGGLVVNDLGGDCDVRIEGINDEYLFFVDGLLDKIGVGVNSEDLWYPAKFNIYAPITGISLQTGNWVDRTSGYNYDWYASRNAINGDYGHESDWGGLKINWHGYQNGTDYYRDFAVYDGKEAALLSATGHTYIDGYPRGVGILTDGPSAPLDVAGTHIRIRTARTPASSSEESQPGMICWDTSFLYVCVDTDTWKRLALVAF